MPKNYVPAGQTMNRQVAKNAKKIKAQFPIGYDLESQLFFPWRSWRLGGSFFAQRPAASSGCAAASSRAR